MKVLLQIIIISVWINHRCHTIYNKNNLFYHRMGIPRIRTTCFVTGIPRMSCLLCLIWFFYFVYICIKIKSITTLHPSFHFVHFAVLDSTSHGPCPSPRPNLFHESVMEWFHHCNVVFKLVLLPPVFSLVSRLLQSLSFIVPVSGLRPLRPTQVPGRLFGQTDFGWLVLPCTLLYLSIGSSPIRFPFLNLRRFTVLSSRPSETRFLTMLA